MKTSELTGPALDWAVATANGDKIILAEEDWKWYSSDWAVGGPIIERERIEFWTADSYQDEYGKFTSIKSAKHPASMQHYEGPTPLIAAMRCYVASKLGDTVDIPRELT